MVELARFVFDLMLPTEDAGDYTLTRAERDDILIWKLFETAIGNFYATELTAAEGWRVLQGRRFEWPVEDQTPGMAAILPGMKTDIILENWKQNRRIVIDTKFTDILTRTTYRENVLKSGHLYQIYAYLRSQEEGWLLHPSTGTSLDETVRIQGHNIRFVTIDLMQPSGEILRALRNLTRQDGIATRTPTWDTRSTV